MERRSDMASGARLFDVLESFGAHERSVPLQEVARRTNLPKSTTHRLLATLAARGYVQMKPDGMYSLGLKAWEVGCRAVVGIGILEGTQPHLDDLADKSGESVFVSVLSGVNVTYISARRARTPVAMHAELGSQAPAHATASGRAILAFSGSETVDAVVNHGLKQLTAYTVVDPGAFRESLNVVKRQGYAIAWRERYDDLAGVAAPIMDYTGKVCAAIAVGGPTSRLTKIVLEESVALHVQSAADKISAELGASVKTSLS